MIDRRSLSEDVYLPGRNGVVVSTTANKTSLDDGSAEFALADANGTEIKSVSAENCVVSGERFHDIKQPPQKMNICDGRFCL